MILTYNFLQILVQATKMSTKISGQLFYYTEKYHKFSLVEKQSTMHGFRARWIFLLVIAFTFVFRILKLNLFPANKEDTSSILMETNICILITTLFVVASERYRVRSSHTEDLVSFINGVIAFENNHMKGTM